MSKGLLSASRGRSCAALEGGKIGSSPSEGRFEITSSLVVLAGPGGLARSAKGGPAIPECPRIGEMELQGRVERFGLSRKAVNRAFRPASRRGRQKVPNRRFDFPRGGDRLTAIIEEKILHVIESSSKDIRALRAGVTEFLPARNQRHGEAWSTPGRFRDFSAVHGDRRLGILGDRAIRASSSQNTRVCKLASQLDGIWSEKASGLRLRHPSQSCELGKIRILGDSGRLCICAPCPGSNRLLKKSPLRVLVVLAMT
jgi:hypothetical protein